MKRIFILLLLAVLGTLLINCEKDEIVVLGNQNDLLNQLQQEFDAQSFSKTISYNFDVDWNNEKKLYSEEFEMDYYEFPVIYGDSFNPNSLNAKNLLKISYKVLVTENSNKHNFYIAKFYKNVGSNSTSTKETSFSKLENFTGYINIFDSENDIIFAKKMNDGMLEGEIYKQKEFITEFITKASQGVNCQLKPIEHITDWYKGTFDENGTKHYEYTHSVITDITWEEVCTTNWIPQYGGYATGSGTFRRGPSSCNDCNIVEVTDAIGEVDDDIVIFIKPDNPISDMNNYLKCLDNTQNATITVYVKQPIDNSSASHDDRYVGHTFVSISQGNYTNVFGFYPDSDYIAPIFNESSNSAMGDDSNDPYSVSISSAVSGTTLQQIINHSTNYASTYDLDDYNCSDYAIEIGNLAGMNLPDAYGTWPGGGGSNPGALGQHIRGVVASGNISTDTAGGNAPTTANNCN